MGLSERKMVWVGRKEKAYWGSMEQKQQREDPVWRVTVSVAECG